MEAVWAWMGQPYSAAGCDPAGLVPAARAGGSSSADRFGGVLLPGRAAAGGEEAGGGVTPSAVSNRICWSGRVPGFNAITVAMCQQCIQGSLYGMGSPRDAMPNLLNLYAAGRLKLDELITRRYALDDVNQAYADMRSGVNIRGVVDFIPAG